MSRKRLMYWAFAGNKDAFPTSTLSVCEHCGQKLAINLHPKEKWLKWNGIGPGIILLAILADNDDLVLAGGVVLLATAIMTIWFEITCFRKWSRFRKTA
ncbi:MAG: hypothetical protein OEZ39_01975 [Gammaproteobacteria bacterium]|nr:hypothetical protein [Gammaproteobacteria bacterium]MDH5650622.1 hypothetical protein [Gammaproteobacteria bacterium]